MAAAPRSRRVQSDVPIDDLDFEARFKGVLQAAREHSSRTNTAVQDFLTKNVGPSSMPEITVWRLHLTATATFLGVLQCLETKFSSLGAFSLIRGLVEACTHLDFIADDSEPGSPALRAIRFEYGALYEWAKVDKLRDPDMNYEDRVRDIDRKMLSLFRSNGHDGLLRRRTYSDVGQTLKKMAASSKPSRMDLLHAATSTAVHATAADFLLSRSPTSVSVEWASSSRRCAWLQFAVVSYDYLTIAALSLADNEERHSVIQDLHIKWLAIYNDPLITNCVSESAPLGEYK